MAKNNSAVRNAPCQVRSSPSTLVSWVTANTYTRSKNSSVFVTRCSPSTRTRSSLLGVPLVATCRVSTLVAPSARLTLAGPGLLDVLGDLAGQLHRQRSPHRHRLVTPDHDGLADDVAQFLGRLGRGLLRARGHRTQHPTRPVDADEPQQHV